MLTELVSYSCRAADYLFDILSNFDLQKLPIQVEKMHNIEHTADEKKHEMIEHLTKEFITPIEREDIIQLAQGIDNVTDSIEDVLQRIYMYNIESMPAEAISFTKLVTACCTAMEDTMKEFHNFKRSATINDSITRTNNIEEEGDKLYLAAVHTLYISDRSTLDIMKWTAAFDLLEGCCNACEDVTDIVESVMMKNS